MRTFHFSLAFLILIVLPLSAYCGDPILSFVTVSTDRHLAPSNVSSRVYYRIPANYEPKSKSLYRVLIIFGGKNCTGENEAAGRQGGLGFDKWADANDIFLVAPGFKNDDYWEPSKKLFS